MTNTYQTLRCVTPMHLLIIPHVYRKGNEWKDVVKVLRTGSESIDDIIYDVRSHYHQHAKRTGETYRIVTRDCGQCFVCRMKRMRDWAMRLTLEARYYNETFGPDLCYFLTLTYDELNLPYTTFGLPCCGNGKYIRKKRKDGTYDEHYYVTGTEVEKDRFIKSLKKKLKDYGYSDEQISNIRYFWVNEYGDESDRPHHHCMLYGVNLFKPFADTDKWNMYMCEQSRRGNPQYFSTLLDTVWKKGRVTFAPFDDKTAAYICKYINKIDQRYEGYTRRAYKLLTEMCPLDNKASKAWIQKQLAQIERPRSYKSQSFGKRYIEAHKEQIINDCGVYLNGQLRSLTGYMYQCLKDCIPAEKKLELRDKYEKLVDAEMDAHTVRTDREFGEYMRDMIAMAEADYKKYIRRCKL